MKKTKKALASLAIAGMALTMVPFNAFADGTVVPTRLAGTTAEQTAVQIAEQTGYTGTAILASSASYGASDALTAGPLAAYVKAPILLQGPGAALNADTKAELSKLKVTKVYVTSGKAVISQSVLDELSGMGITVESLGGADRFETSVNIAKKLVELGAPVKKVAVAYGWLNQDALSIAAIASAANEPIILTEKSGLSASAKAFLAANPGITAADVIGGTGVIDASVLAQLPNPTRHAGASAYDTNNQVIQDFASSLTFDNVYVANGKTGIDALAGAPLAAKTKSAIVLTDGTVPAAATFVHGKMTATGVVTALGGAAVVSDAVRTGVATGQVTPPQGALAVTSVSAVSVSGIKVVFNQAPADTSKVTFAVTRTGSPATVTANWNDAKTEATLAASGNYAEGDYIVDVKNGTTDLGSTTVSITSQRVGKITIDSDVLAVTDSGKTGYVGYHAYDQYGTDITTNYLASDSYIQWNCGVGSVVSNNKGLLTVTPFNSATTVLTQYTTTVLTAVTQNQTIPASVNATLNISTSQGTISDITLSNIQDASGDTTVVPTVGDTEKYYIGYTAKDMAGNPTNNIKLVQKGLITNHDNNNPSSDYPLISSNSTLITCKVVEDPTDDQKAALEVTVNDPSDYNLMQDQPITITASTYTGKTSSYTFTLKRKQKVDSFTIMAPTTNIASGETATVIPFLANDQAGNKLTKYSDIKGLVTLSPAGDALGTVGLYLEENADGTAALKYNAPTLPTSANTAQQQNLSATVSNTGKFSNISINVDLPVKPDTLKVDDSVVLSRMEIGAVQRMDFGNNAGGFKVLDQYGRVIDMTSKFNTFDIVSNQSYFVQALLPGQSIDTTSGAIIGTPDRSIVTFATSSGADGKTAGAEESYAFAGHQIELKGVKAGSATVNFALMMGNPADLAHAKSARNITKSMSFTVLGDDDIKGYVMDEAKDPYYAIYGDTSNYVKNTAQQQDFSDIFEPNVYGTTSSGSKVALDVNKIIARSVSNSDFSAIASTTGCVGTDKITRTQVTANALSDSTKTGSSATLTVTVMNDDDKRPHTATTTITSLTADAIAASAGYNAYSVDRKDTATATGITKDGNTVTVRLNGKQKYFTTAGANFAAISGVTTGSSINADSILNAIAGRDLTRFTPATGVSSNRGYVYLWGKDQYGSKDTNLSSVMVADSSSTTSGGIKFAQIASDGTLQFNYMPTASDFVVLSGVTNNGLVTTVRIVFKNN